MNQREVGADTHGFSSALKHVLRQDPDVILVGEMRDLETISTAITAAETGHLVFATLHTQDAPQTIDRIIDVFPPHQQQQVRVQLSTTLQGVVTQQLIPTADGQGRVAACEVLVTTPAVRNLIREGKVHQIYSSMQAGGRYGMQTMDMSLAQHVKAGRITQQLAFERCHDPEELQRLIGGGTLGGAAVGGESSGGGHRHGRRHGRHGHGRDVETADGPDLQYKVRDRAGNMVTGTLVADSELLVLQRLREMGYTPLEVGKEKKGLNLEINLRKAKVKLKDLSVSRQFATMINSGLPILRALAILRSRPTNKLLRRRSLNAVPTSSRARRSRARCRSTRRSSTTSTSRW